MTAVATGWSSTRLEVNLGHDVATFACSAGPIEPSFTTARGTRTVTCRVTGVKGTYEFAVDNIWMISQSGAQSLIAPWHWFSTQVPCLSDSSLSCAFPVYPGGTVTFETEFAVPEPASLCVDSGCVKLPPPSP